MSVESSYFVVEWARFQSLPKDTDLDEHFILAPDTHDEEEDGEWQAEGSRRFELGNQIDRDAFESWGFFTDVSDWLRALRSKLDPSVERPFTQLFTAIGILFDDSYGPAAIKQGVEFSHSYIAAISPSSVQELLSTARALDRGALEREFDRLLSQHPCRGLPNGRAVVDWVDALQEGLASVGKDEGILVLCPG
jgi:hypothetical protein